jgi:hypothetical protein
VVRTIEGTLILDGLHSTDEGADMSNSASENSTAPQSTQYASTPAPNRLKVFISSTMTDLRDVRELVSKELRDREIDAWVYESNAGARPDSVIESSLQEVQASDVYLGLFSQSFGAVTIQEYQQARSSGKPCFIYIRDRLVERDPRLEDFLNTHVMSPGEGVTYAFFESALALGKQAATDIMTWLIRMHRDMTAKLNEANISQEEIRRLTNEIQRLQSSTKQVLPHGTTVDYLAQQMRGWFSALGYRILEHEVRTEKQVEWILEVPARRRYDRIVVRGLGVRAEASDVISLRRAVDKQKADEGWLVAARWVSDAARQAALTPDNSDLLCLTFDELIDQEVDFSQYMQWLDSEVKKRGIDKYYVPLACVKDEFDPDTHERIGQSRYDERNGWLDGYVDQWLADPAKEHLSILGEFGTGKTWFTLHYAWTALQRYEDAKNRQIDRPRLPLVIPLRDYAKAVSVESLFSEFFFRKHEVKLLSYSAFEQLNRMGKLLLIFDGFDEMASRIDRQQMINNFWELAKVVVPGAKAILTCRSEHFPNAQEGRDLLGAQLRASTSALTGEPPQFEVLELEKLNDDQIRAILSHKGSSSSVDAIFNNEEVLDLMRRPVMADLVIEALPEIEAGKAISLSHVYLYAVVRKMERDVRDERTFTSLADKLYFLSEISWEMLSTDQMRLNYRQFPDRLRALFGDAVVEAKDLDHWHYDMMGQTMLVRNADGDYTPAHRSLAEFFVAYKFAAELGVLNEDFEDVARQRSEVDVGLPKENYRWSSYFVRRSGNDGKPQSIAPLDAFVPEDVKDLARTVGLAHIDEVVHNLMQGMIRQDAAFLKARLFSIIEKTAGMPTETSALVGANCMRILVRQDVDALVGASLRGVNLQEAGFGSWPSALDLTNVDLEGSNLEGANLTNARLVNANLRGARLAGCHGLPFDQDSAFTKVAITSDDLSIALGDALGGVGVYGLDNPEVRLFWTVLDSPISALAFSGDSSLLAVASHAGMCIVSNMNSRDQVASIELGARVADLAFNRRANTILAAINTGFDRGRLVKWEIGQDQVQEVAEMDSQIMCIDLSTQGADRFNVYIAEGEVVLIDLSKDPRDITRRFEQRRKLAMFSLAMDRVRESAPGTSVASYLVRDGSRLVAGRWTPWLAFGRMEESPGGTTTHSLLMLIDHVKQEIVWQGPWRTRGRQIPMVPQRVAGVSMDGRWLVDASVGQLSIYDAVEDRLLCSLPGHVGDVQDVDISGAGNVVITVGMSDSRVILYRRVGDIVERKHVWSNGRNYSGLDVRGVEGLNEVVRDALRDLGART